MLRSKTIGLTLKQRDERRAEVARRLRDGEPAADFAKALGLAVNRVYAIGAKARDRRTYTAPPRSARCWRESRGRACRSCRPTHRS
jgi:hypothetical protein